MIISSSSCMIICIVISDDEVEVEEDWDGSIRSESNLQIDIGYSPDSTIYQYGRDRLRKR